MGHSKCCSELYTFQRIINQNGERRKPKRKLNESKGHLMTTEKMWVSWHDCMSNIKIKRNIKSQKRRNYPSTEDDSAFTSVGSEFKNAPCK